MTGRPQRCSQNDADAREIASALRGSTKSVYQWRRARRADGALLGRQGRQLQLA